MKIVALAGALRKDSWNKKLVRVAADIARQRGATVDYVDLRDFPLPVYDEDIETSTGLPDPARALEAKVKGADALIISTPTYNYSIPGVLKNYIDWLSRFRPHPFGGKRALITAASPSVYGGMMGAWALRVPLEALGVTVHPGMFLLSNAHEAFDEGGQLKVATQRERLEKLVGEFVA